MKLCSKIYVSFWVFMINVLTGIASFIVGSTFRALMQRTNVKMVEISSIILSQGIGKTIGSAITSCAFTSKYINHRLVLMGAVSLTALTTIAIGLTTNIWGMNLLFCFQGIGVGFQEAGSFITTVFIWGNHSPVLFQIVLAGMGIGSMAAPLIVRPFITDFINNKTLEITENITYASNTSIDGSLQFTSSPYYITGGIGILIVFGILGSFCLQFERHKDECIDKEINELTQIIGDKKSDEMIRKCPSIAMKILVNVFLFFMCGIQYGFGNLLPEIIDKSSQFSLKDGTYFAGLTWFCFTLSRIINAIITEYKGPTIVLIISTNLLMLSSVTPLFGGKYCVVFISIIVNSLGLAALYPGIIGWAKVFLNIKEWDIAIFIAVAYLGDMLIGFCHIIVLEKLGVQYYYLFLTVQCGIILIILILLLCILYKSHKNIFTIRKQ